MLNQGSTHQQPCPGEGEGSSAMATGRWQPVRNPVDSPLLDDDELPSRIATMQVRSRSERCCL
jgi:hypothetical protein